MSEILESAGKPKERVVSSVWKVSVKVGYNHLELPKGSKVLTMQMQGTQLTAWAYVPDVSAEVVALGMYVVGTGWSLRDSGVTILDTGQYIATVQSPNGLVWHAFMAPSAIS